MKNLIVIDKDGTLTSPRSGNKFVQNPTDQILMDGVVEACRLLIDDGYVLAIASNQGGIEAGHKSLEDAIFEMNYCMWLLNQSGIEIKIAFFCPDFAGAKCYEVIQSEHKFLYSIKLKDPDAPSFRKPGAGMLKLASKIDKFDYLWMIGDREEDRLAADAAGFNFLAAARWRGGESPLNIPF